MRLATIGAVLSLVLWLAAASLLAAAPTAPAATSPATTRAATAPASLVQSYTVDRAVRDFPAIDDFTTPQSACATIYRHDAAGDIDWRALSIARLAERLPPSPTTRRAPPTTAEAQRSLSLHMLEVLRFADRAAVLSRAVSRRGTRIDMRFLERENGRWLNAGNEEMDDMDAARERFLRFCRVAKPPRPAVADPQTHLKPYVEFLATKAVAPEQFILDAVEQHKLTIIGEIHHRPTYWQLNARVVQDPRFARNVCVIYMELPMNHQGLVDRFLSSNNPDPAPIIEMLRDNLQMGWPDRPMLDFFQAVWKTNQTLPPDQRLRIVLVDMPRPWKDIRRRPDLMKYEVDRNQLMADNILADQRAHGADPRHALFIVGYMHVAELKLAADPSRPVLRTAGWHLRQALGNQLFTMVQHGPIITNDGRVFGRVALGLFDDAFAASSHHPVGFALPGSPFGTLPFDADGEVSDTTSSTYEEAFNGYLYLGRLEDEIFSPLIDGFYTDEFAREVDRRYRLIGGAGLASAWGIPKVDGQSVTAYMSRTWGTPRGWASQLGPATAWRYGDNWRQAIEAEHYSLAASDPKLSQALKGQAAGLFETLRGIDYARLQHARQALEAIDYRVVTRYDLWMNWTIRRFRRTPIRKVLLGDMTKDAAGRPAIHYTLTLSDDSKLEGVLSFYYDVMSQSWHPTDGLDWHLAKPSTAPTSRISPQSASVP
jgi:hypothetical protein